jgi:hypothetical protein
MVAGAAAIAAIAGLSAARHAFQSIGPSPARVSSPPAPSPRVAAPIQFEPTTVQSTDAPFKPTIVQQTRPKKKRVAVRPRNDDEDAAEQQLPASALKDPFAP